MIEKKEDLGWVQRRTSNPSWMEASLRYALLRSSEDSLGSGFFVFPWYKEIKGQSFFLCFRKIGTISLGSLEFSLDLGQLQKDKKRFLSSAWIDVRVRNHLHHHTHNLFGKVSRENEVHVVNPLDLIKRISYSERRPSGNWGIYVAPNLRRQKVGAALVTAARIILKTLGIRTLIFEEILEVGRGDWRREFYESLGVHFFNLYLDRWLYTKGTVIVGSAAIPTKATELRPYRFE